MASAQRCHGLCAYTVHRPQQMATPRLTTAMAPGLRRIERKGMNQVGNELTMWGAHALPLGASHVFFFFNVSFGYVPDRRPQFSRQHRGLSDYLWSIAIRRFSSLLLYFLAHGCCRGCLRHRSIAHRPTCARAPVRTRSHSWRQQLGPQTRGTLHSPENIGENPC